MDHASKDSLETLSYGAKTAHVIRQALAGFAGGEAIVSEMVQNADDAGASRIEFKFTSDALEVFNDSAFTEPDFRNIGAIASGPKRNDEGKIGTWGIGFLSVYHITDAPELESAGRRIVFDPYQHKLPFQPSDVVRETRFRLPWRKQPSELGKEIEAPTWSPRDIVGRQKHLEASIYSLILFTRHVTQIGVYVEERPLAVVSLEKLTEENFGDFQVETWDITYKAGKQHRDDKWLCYRAEVPEHLAVSGVTIKDREVRLAFPIKSSKWLDEHVPNVLYNFLPVPTIPTGLPFHINGAFFPDNNRNTVLLDERSHPKRARWNINVLGTLGELFLNALYDLRERITEEESPRRFYELLPLVNKAWTVGEAVSRPFLDKAGKLEIVWTSLDQWAKPRDVYINVRGSRLPDLVSDHMPVLPTGKEVGAPQAFKDFLTDEIEPERERARWLRWGEVFDFLQRHMKREVALADSHPMVNTRTKLDAFYKLLDKEKIGAEDRDKLRLTPICLCEDDRLRRFKDAQWIEPQGRDLLTANHGLPLVKADLLHKYGDIVRDLTGAFRGRELVQWLQQQSWPASPFGPGTTPLVRDRAHLRALLRFLDDDLDLVDHQKLNKLPLVLTEDGILRRRGAGLFIHEDEAVRRALTSLGFTFVHPYLARDPYVSEVYEHVGVAVLTPQAVIKRLDTPPESISDEVLIVLYGYFYRSRGQLQEENKKRLRALPLYRTQQGRLAPLEHNGNRLLLPPVQHPDEAGIAVLDKLGLDNTIHSHLANREAARQFLMWLGAKERDSLTLIREEILPHYDDKKLDHTDRLALLHYISDTTRHYAEARVKPEGMPQLWQQLKAAPLIRCADGKYREGHKVNFAGPLFERVFSGTYRRPHPQYEIPVAQEGEADQTPYTKSPWHWLFQALGVNTAPTDADLVRAVENITQEGPPTSEWVQAIQRIYTYLNEEQQSHLLDRREGLRKLARMEWLPARGNEEHWHRPAVMYPASQENLIGTQALLLPFPEPSKPLRDLLGMRGNPPVDLIARHLLASAERGAAVHERVYLYLGRGWDELPQTIRSRLQKEPVIWETKGQRYWTADKTFFGDRSPLFGARRLSILDPPGGEIQHFLRKIGAKADPQPWEDGAVLLREIASDYADGKPLDADDLYLLHRQFDHLGYRLDHPAAQRSLARLRGVAFVPDADARLHQPERIALADQPALLDHFPEGKLPLVNGSDKRDDTESTLTQSGVRFLKAAGVAPLSRLLRRYPEDVQPDREEEALSAKLQTLAHALQRIYVTHTGEVDEDRFKPLHVVQAWHCSRLAVRHVLDNDAGWQVQGSVGSAAALHYARAKRLYFVPAPNGKVPVTAVALELNCAFFPELTVSPVIEQLLHRPMQEWETYLDDHNFDQVHRSEAAPATKQGAVTTFSAPSDEEPSLLSKETEPQPQTATDTPDTQQNELDLSGDGTGLLADSPASARSPEMEEKRSDTDPTRYSEKDGATINTGANGTDKAPPAAISTREQPADLSSTPDEAQPEGEDKATDTSHIRSKPEEETPPRTSTSKRKPREREEIPAFTGQLRSPVISLPNNYSTLRQRYGFPRTAGPTRPQPSQAEQSDEDWKPDAIGETPDEDRITQVRFTLHYCPRYQGFLKLHARAFKMLADRPARLRCLTEWDYEFDLYADYDEEGILYNQEALPAFFDQHNIPAGGIVYLELVHGNTVRLFWKKPETIIKDVIRYEAHDDGTVEKFITPADRFHCEVDEAVYRAETRFEDPTAFFQRAIDKSGVFETICHAFGEAGQVLSYMEVLNNVQQERGAAAATVLWLLYHRDCFVPEEDDRWRFVPENGLGSISSVDGLASRPEAEPHTRPKDGLQPGRDRVEKAKITDDPTATLLAEAARNLDAEVQRLRSPIAKPQEVLQQLVSSLRKFLQRLEQDFAALQTPSSADEQLDELWQRVQEQPSDHAAQQELVEHLFEQLQAAQPTINVVLQAIQSRVARTSEARRISFYKVLTTLAEQARQANLYNVAHMLYLFLQTQHAGDFRQKIGELKQAEALHHTIEQAEQSHDLSERWQLLAEAWRLHPDAPMLRKAVIRALLHDAAQIAHNVENILAGNNVPGALAAFEVWRAPLVKLEDAWRESDEAVALIGPVVRQLFFALIEEAREKDQVSFYRAALQVATLVSSKRSYLNADELLEAAAEVADALEDQANVSAAAILMTYAWHLVDPTAVSGAVAYRYNERLSTYWERLNQFHLAHECLVAAREAALSDHQLGRLRSRLSALEAFTKHDDPVEETSRLQDEFQLLIQNESFMTLVSPASFAELRRHHQ